MIELVLVCTKLKTIASYLILRRRTEMRKFENAAVVKSCLCVCGVQNIKMAASQFGGPSVVQMRKKIKKNKFHREHLLVIKECSVSCN